MINKLIKNKKSSLDEMQEQKLLKIEHNAAWIAFFGLVIAILVQTAFGGPNSFKETVGELIILFILAIYIIIACLKNGIWDRRLKPTLKTNLLMSCLAGFVSSLTLIISSYMNYHHFLGSLAAGIFTFAFTFILTFLLLTLCSSMYKKRIRNLEDINEEE